MAAVFGFLQSEPFFSIFLTVAVGIWLGRFKAGGIALGSVVCIILVGLVLSTGAYQLTGTALSLPDLLKAIFFNLFIFAIGVKIGPQFFAGLERDGWRMVTIGLIVAAIAPALAYLFGVLFQWPQGTVAGMLAGSNNSSATFGAANAAVQSEALRLLPGNTREAVVANLAAAFALCYTVSQVQFVVLMKLMPRLAGFDAVKAARDFLASMSRGHSAPLPGTMEAADAADRSITVRSYHVSEALAGHTVADVRSRAPKVTVELVRRGTEWIAVGNDTRFAPGDQVTVSAPLASQVKVRETLGPEVPDAEARARLPLTTADVVVGRREAAGRTLQRTLTEDGPGLSASALFRAGEELPLAHDVPLKLGDVIRVTGTPGHVEAFGKRAGQVVTASHMSDILTLSIGLLIGAALGAIPVPIFGVSVAFGSSAVLVTGIVFGWLKTRHPALGGPISEGGRRMLEDLGLNVFTAVLALNSGEAVLRVLTTGPFLSLVACCLVISCVPELVAWWVGRHVLKVNEALLMGAIAGARQNTSSMQAAQEISESAVPGIGYPVPLAIVTVSMSIIAYFFALFI